jgi:hypothetical protein
MFKYFKYHSSFKHKHTLFCFQTRKWLPKLNFGFVFPVHGGGKKTGKGGS